MQHVCTRTPDNPRSTADSVFVFCFFWRVNVLCRMKCMIFLISYMLDCEKESIQFTVLSFQAVTRDALF